MRLKSVESLQGLSEVLQTIVTRNKLARENKSLELSFVITDSDSFNEKLRLDMSWLRQAVDRR